MTKNLLIAFLSVFMLKATINAATHSADDINEGCAHKKARTSAQNIGTEFSNSDATHVPASTGYVHIDLADRLLAFYERAANTSNTFAEATAFSSFSERYEVCPIYRRHEERMERYYKRVMARNRGNIPYFLKKPDSIMYPHNDEYCEATQNTYPLKPTKGCQVVKKRWIGWERVQSGPTHRSTALEELVPMTRNLDGLFAQHCNY